MSEPVLSKDAIVSTLPALNIDELLNVQKGVEAELKERNKTRAKEAKQAINEVIKQYGFNSVDEVYSAPKEVNKAAVKYRNTENPEQTWTGRGKKPLWLVSALNQGNILDDFKVQGA